VAQIGKQDKVPFSSLSVKNWTFQSTCQDGGNVGTISVNTFVDSATSLIEFDKDYLGTVTATGTLTVTETIVKSCTGVETPGQTLSMRVSLDLHATSPLTSTIDRTVTNVPEGTDVFTLNTDKRDAAGSMSIDGIRYPPIPPSSCTRASETCSRRPSDQVGTHNVPAKRHWRLRASRRPGRRSRELLGEQQM